MKATISASGLMRLEPETELEAYALSKWAADALVSARDEKLAEDCHWRGSMLVVSTDWQPT